MTWLGKFLEVLGYALLALGVGIFVILGISALAATITRDEPAPEPPMTRVNHTGEASPSGPHRMEGRLYGPLESSGAAVPARIRDGVPASPPGPGRRHPDDRPPS